MGPKGFIAGDETIELPILGNAQFSVAADKALLIGNFEEFIANNLTSIGAGTPDGFMSLSVSDESLLGIGMTAMSSSPIVDGREGFMTTGVFYSMLGPRDEATSHSQVAVWISDSNLDGSYLGYAPASDIVASGISTS